MSSNSVARLCDSQDIAEMSGYTRRHVTERLMRQPGAPRAIRLGNGRPRWLQSEVLPWIEGRLTGSRGGRPRKSS